MHTHHRQTGGTGHSASKGITLVELIVTLAIFGAVSTVLIGSFVTLFSINQQSGVSQGAYDDVRLVLDSIEREIQGAKGTLNCPGGSCERIAFEVETSANRLTTIAYQKIGTKIQKAVESHINGDPCRTIDPLNIDGISANCWQDLTGDAVTIDVLSFRVDNPDTSTSQRSPLVSVGLKGTAVDSVNNIIPLDFSTSASPRNKILVETASNTEDPSAPTLLLTDSRGTTAGCVVSAVTPPTTQIGAPADGGLYFTLCTAVNISASASDTFGLVYIQISKDGTVVERVEIPGSKTYSTTFSNIPLTNYTVHEFTVRTVNTAGAATQRTFRIQRGNFPSVPASLTATPGACGTGRITLTWPNAADALSYDLLRDGATITTVTSPHNHQPITNNGAVHTYQVRGVNPLGVSVWSTPVRSANAPLPCAPTFTLTALPTSIAFGASSRITWSAVTDATGCTATMVPATGGGVWTGAKAIGGGFTDVTPTLSGTYTYTLTCTGPGGTTPRSVTVTVANPQCTAGWSAGQLIYDGWTNGATAWCNGTTYGQCRPAPQGTTGGTQPSAGGSIQKCCYTNGDNLGYIRTCGTVSYPSVSLTGPATASVGASISLAWNSTNASACSASVSPASGCGSWSGSKTVDGSQSVTPTVAGTCSYRITCTNGPDSSTDTLNVTVGSAPVGGCWDLTRYGELSGDPSYQFCDATEYATLPRCDTLSPAPAKGNTCNGSVPKCCTTNNLKPGNAGFTCSASACGGGATIACYERDCGIGTLGNCDQVNVMKNWTPIDCPASACGALTGPTYPVYSDDPNAVNCPGGATCILGPKLSDTFETCVTTELRDFFGPPPWKTCTGVEGDTVPLSDMMTNGTCIINSSPAGTCWATYNFRECGPGGACTGTWQRWGDALDSSSWNNLPQMTSAPTVGSACSNQLGETEYRRATYPLTWQYYCSGCRVAGPTVQCSDGIDNDGDGRVDFPNDTGCTNATSDNDEADTSAPTVALTANTPSITVGGSVTLTWSSTLATACTASGVTGWSGSKSISGNQALVMNTAGTYTFSMTCTGPGGTSNPPATVIVTVNPPITPPATASLSVTRNSILAGESIGITWSSANASACTGGGLTGWSGAKAVGGVQSVTINTPGTYTLTLSCTGPGGTSPTQFQTVSVGSVVPTATLSVSPSTITAGGTVTLTWGSTNATGCTASNGVSGWAGAKGYSGSQSFTISTAGTYAFSLYCSGLGGNSPTQTQTVIVDPPVGPCGVWRERQLFINFGGGSCGANSTDFYTEPCGPDGTTRTWNWTQAGRCQRVVYECDCNGETERCMDIEAMCYNSSVGPECIDAGWHEKVPLDSDFCPGAGNIYCNTWQSIHWSAEGYCP